MDVQSLWMFDVLQERLLQFCVERFGLCALRPPRLAVVHEVLGVVLSAYLKGDESVHAVTLEKPFVLEPGEQRLDVRAVTDPRLRLFHAGPELAAVNHGTVRSMSTLGHTPRPYVQKAPGLPQM